jgi:hypothetical protein
MKNTPVTAVGFWVLLLVCASCSEESPRYVTGVDANRSLGELTVDEWKNTCATAHTFVESHVSLSDDQLCRFSAFWSLTFRFSRPPLASDEQARAECRAEYDGCMAQEKRRREEMVKPSCRLEERCKKPPASCTATVADLEACGSAMPETWRRLFSELPACADVTLAKLAPAPNDPRDRLPARCEALKATCPGVEPEDHLFLPFPCQ